MAFKENFEFELNFSNSTNYEKFSIKVPNIMKNALFFVQNILLVFDSNQRKKLYKIASLTFRLHVDDLIFFLYAL
jgi:hypothetical protein